MLDMGDKLRDNLTFTFREITKKRNEPTNQLTHTPDNDASWLLAEVFRRLRKDQGRGSFSGLRLSSEPATIKLN